MGKLRLIRVLTNGEIPGDLKRLNFGQYLSVLGWTQCTPGFRMEQDESAFVKGSVMLLVDKVGATIYRNVDRQWARIGGAGYLTMYHLPLVLFNRGRYGVNLTTGLCTKRVAQT